jgi:putative membrane protein insertion efficiency factor
MVLIKFYQKAISPFFVPRCRYFPSCSQYAIDALKKFGYIKGFLMASWRVLRCNPFSKGGVDKA